MPAALTWSEVSDLATGDRDTADPLGLRAIANRIADDLVPVVTQRVNSVRGFSLLCMGILGDRHVTDRRDSFLRAERLYVAAWTLLSQRRQDALWRPAGTTAARRNISDPTFFITRPILNQQLSGGVWGGYSRAAREIGFITGGRGFSTTQLTSSGRELGEEFRSQLLSHMRTPIGRPRVNTISTDQVREVSRRIRPPSRRERDAVSQALSNVDRDRKLSKLYAQRDHVLRDDLDQSGLTQEQSDAWVASRDINTLISHIEAGYRSWVTGTTEVGRPRPINRAAASRCKPWDADNTIARLDAAIRSGGGWPEIHRWHQQIMTERGSDSWEVDVPDPARTRWGLPKYRLDALRGLLHDGVVIGRA